ncbi:MAG: DUF421 domain-containing protein [Candidatus Desulforudis sp.]|nr:DUF421 domain-containing protein [Desulforudis sp.]
MNVAAEVFEVIWHTLAVFLAVLLVSRIVGKKLLAQLTYFDFVIGIILGTIAGAFVVQTTRGLFVLISPVVLAAAVLLIEFMALKSRAFRKIAQGEPLVVIRNGKILEENMRKVRYDIQNLRTQLRNKDIFDFSEVEFAVLEPNGQLSVLKKSAHLPLTPKDLKLDTQYKGMPTELILDGHVLTNNLIRSGLDFTWLYRELQGRNVREVKEVFYAALNADGTLYVDLRRDPPENL